MSKFTETNLPTVHELADLLDLHDEERLEEAIEAVSRAGSARVRGEGRSLLLRLFRSMTLAVYRMTLPRPDEDSCCW